LTAVELVIFNWHPTNVLINEIAELVIFNWHPTNVLINELTHNGKNNK